MESYTSIIGVMFLFAAPGSMVIIFIQSANLKWLMAFKSIITKNPWKSEDLPELESCRFINKI